METTLENATIISIVGFATVIVCLVGFALIISLVNKFNSVVAERKQKLVSATTTNASTAISSTGGISDIDIALIASAVTATMGDKVRIRKISFLAQSTDNTAWSQMSKSQKFEDHKIVQKRRVNYEK